MDDSGLMEMIWVNDPSILIFWMEDPAWVGDLEDIEELFLIFFGSGRANLKPLPVLRPPL